MLNLIKKYIWLTIGLGLAFVLLAAVGSRLFFVMKRHQKEEQELNAAKTRLDQLYQRAIFPSAANTTLEREKMADLTDQFNELNSLLSEGQVLPEEMEAAEFMTYFEKTMRRIRDRLQAGRVVFPEKYAFGFEKYAGGLLPVPRDIPRLVQQLKMTERLCQVLPDAAVKELLAFTREDFEAAVDKPGTAAPAGRGRAPAPAAPAPGAGAGRSLPEGQLYSVQHFKMSFRALEGSVLGLLNCLARLPMFTVVTRVEITNPRREISIGVPDATKPAAGEAASKTADKAPPGELSRDKRIVLGKEEVEVKLEMDVYNFGLPIDFREGTMKKKK